MIEKQIQDWFISFLMRGKVYINCINELIKGKDKFQRNN